MRPGWASITMSLRVVLALVLVIIAGMAGWVRPAGAAEPISEYDVGTDRDHPEGIAYGPDGNLWVSHRDGDRISRVTPDGNTTHFPLPRGGSPARIVAGPDGALWFTEYTGNRIGRITVDGVMTEYAIPTPNSRPIGIASQGDRALWFTESKTGKLGRITVDGEIEEYAIGKGSAPTELAIGPDERPWFTMHGRNSIGRLVDGKLDEIRIPTQHSGVTGIAPAPDGQGMWFTESAVDRLGWVSVDNTDHITEYPLRITERGRVGPTQLVAGSDDALWVTAPNANAIVRVLPDGSGLREYDVPTNKAIPYAITVGPGKDPWFTERSSGKVGRIRTESTPSVSRLELTVQPAAAAAGRQKTRTSDLPASELTNTEVLQSSPWRASPWRASPLSSTPWRASPWRASPLSTAPWSLADLEPVQLSALPLRDTIWQEVLAGTSYEGVPLQTITVADVFAIDPVPQAVQDLSMVDIDLDKSPWRTISVAALLLTGVALDRVPAPESESWCAFLAGQPSNCGNGVVPSDTTLLELELAGDDLSAYYARQVELTEVDFTGSDAPVLDFFLTDILLSQTPLGSLPTSTVPSLVSCAASDCATLADAQTADALAEDATVDAVLDLLPVAGLDQLGLGELLSGVFDGTEIGYEDGPLSTVLDHALIRPNDLLSYRVGFAVDCDEVAGLWVDLAVGERFRALPGSARIATDEGEIDVPDPERSGNALLFSPPTGTDGVCAGAGPGETASAELAVDVEPGATLGTYQARAAASTSLDRSAGLETTAGPAAPVTADDSHDAGAVDAPAQPLALDELTAGHLAHSGDVDLYAVDAPETGATLRISLSHLPADYDLVSYGPSAAVPSTGVRDTPWRASPWRASPVEDGSEQAATDDGDLAPDGLQDVPLLDTPLRATSIRRGTATESVSIPVLDSDRGGTFVIQVSGYSGAHHARPYVLRANAVPGPDPLPCRERTFVGEGSPGAFPPLPLPATTKTLILTDVERMGDLYGATEASDLLAKLRTYAARPDVAGVVVPVESDPSANVREAMAAWDADPCSPATANEVVGEVNKVVDHVRQDLTELRSVVLVGSDEALPMGRVPDLVTEANEKDYGEAAIDGKDTAVSRALSSGLLLTDDPYGDFDPQTWLNGRLYVPDVALGRLVETPAEITTQLDQYAASDGVLAPESGEVFGYDFLADGSEAIGTALSGQVSTSTRTDNAWNSTDALAALNQPAPSYLAVNAHYNHYGALPAESFTNGGADILYSSDAEPAPGSVLFTVGCHAGLNLPDIAVSVPTNAEQDTLTDWAQASASRSALFTGNTGYGYGDTEVVGYSERLLLHYAQRLSDAQVTAGQALMFAKQRYAGDLAVIGVYDSKVLQEAVFYGLPTYRMTESGGEGGSIAPPLKSAERAPGAQEPTLRSAPFSTDPATQRVETERGSYWTVPGQLPQVTHFRPVEPRLSVDVTASDGLPVHGALIEELASDDVTGVDPLYSRPTIDLTANEPEREAESLAFPAQLQSVNRMKAPNGLRDRLVLMAGQTFVDEGEPARQRLFDHLAGTVYRSASDDWAPPGITDVNGTVIDGVAVFSTSTRDADVQRGVVMYRDDAGPEWQRAELGRLADGQWSAGAPLRTGATTVTEFFVQLVDEAGNVAVSSNKGRRFTAEPAEPSDGELSFELSSPRPDSGFYRESPDITIGGLADGEGAMVSVDGGPWFPYEKSFEVSGDGVHVIEALADSGTRGIGYVAVDSTPPEVTGNASPAANAAGWWNGSVTVTWTCVDAVSGVASCPEPSVVSDDGGGQSVTGTAIDRAGNVSTGAVNGIDIDSVPPSATIVQPRLPILHRDQRLTGTARDGLSGISDVTVVYKPILLGKAESVSAQLSCDDTGRECEWSAAVPRAIGYYLAVAKTTDVADNRDPQPPSVLVRVVP